MSDPQKHGEKKPAASVGRTKLENIKGGGWEGKEIKPMGSYQEIEKIKREG